VDSIYDDANLLQGQVVAGQTGVGYFQYDTTLPDTNSDPGRGDYGPTITFQFQLGGYTFQQNIQAPSGNMVVVNDQSYFGDTFSWQSLSNLDDVPGTFSATDVGMELRQYESDGATAFSSDGLPTTLSLDEFSSSDRQFYIEFNPGFQQVINLTVTSLSTQVVPEPAVLGLLTISVGAMLMRRRPFLTGSKLDDGNRRFEVRDSI
jgi:hypothetical protein